MRDGRACSPSSSRRGKSRSDRSVVRKNDQKRRASLLAGRNAKLKGKLPHAWLIHIQGGQLELPA